MQESGPLRCGDRMAVQNWLQYRAWFEDERPDLYTVDISVPPHSPQPGDAALGRMPLRAGPARSVTNVMTEYT